MTKQLTLLSLVASTLLASDSMNVDTITVKGKGLTTSITEVSKEEVKSADLAESLSKNVPSISLVRRSGIANDIILRGQKKDNINVLIDGAKIHGACPNRMDPPTSHVLTNNIENIEIQEGPFDVENFGTLSGIVNINTKKPSKETTGEVNVNFGSFGYKKLASTISGGTEKFRVLLSASTESGEQYEDGNGNTLAEQTSSNILTAPQFTNFIYQPRFANMDAFEKKSFMGKIYVDLTDNQELKLSYTANRSDNILYPSSKMDALYDDSDLFNTTYTIKNLAQYSKELSINYYYSDVEHPMSTKYRNAGAVNFITSTLDSTISGVKVKNSFEINDADIVIGLDSSTRNWDGVYLMNGVMNRGNSINDVDTKNRAIFTTFTKEYGKLNLEFGARYDNTDVETAGIQQDNDYNSLSANLFGTYKYNASTEYFAGVGRSSRVPDARELYFTSAPMPTAMLIGTPTLEETYNVEFDVGINKKYENGMLNAKVFYSMLTDFIAYNANNMANRFENIDADIYGIELSGLYFLSDDLTLNYALAYQRGEKDSPLTGQTDKDLAEIPPLKVNLTMDYTPTEKDALSLNLVAVNSWDNFDVSNGEQELSGFAILNAKYNRDLTNGFDITLGIDNIFDKAYAMSNTYKDLTLLGTDPASNGNVMLLNEPGRYLYANLSYKF